MLSWWWLKLWAGLAWSSFSMRSIWSEMSLFPILFQQKLFLNEIMTSIYCSSISSITFINIILWEIHASLKPWVGMKIKLTFFFENLLVATQKIAYSLILMTFSFLVQWFKIYWQWNTVFDFNQFFRIERDRATHSSRVSRSLCVRQQKFSLCGVTK